ncbi:hypothetical protein GGS23DRAFT_598989 [Durotheca rogersii]|uniref:uncharacterized protein n=1 Tax=Durotheca rogersii TaxID=419775 RepID=UPI00221FE4E8|nr:uncharacterized protein GGS23DRAFT_598989 [Durotheca rogersii]KAI5860770.1 hypothetical protein GGS23DRAFT_598989 [Durotheca rogersii]
MTTAARRRGNERQAALLEKGGKLYGEKEYDRAEAAFSEAMGMCKCGIALGEPCTCRDIMRGIDQSRLKDVLAERCSCAAASNSRCGESLHLSAFDSLIAVYEKRGQIDEALERAKQMINLCPREPKSFLRLAKLLRLKGLNLQALLTYKQGIDLVERKYPDHALLDTLRQLRDKMQQLVARFDPIVTLPPELWHMVFQYLDLRTKCRCLRVSKTWKLSLTAPGARNLWKVQGYAFSRPGSGPAMQKSVRANVSYAAHQITELSVDDCFEFFTKMGRTPVLFLTPHLRVLKLRGRSYRGHPVPPPFELKPSMLDMNRVKALRLTHLYIGETVQASWVLLWKLIESSHTTLEELSVLSFQHIEGSRVNFVQPSPPAFRDWPKLERLKTIRLVTHPAWGHWCVDVGDIVDVAPNAEEVWLDMVYCGDPTGPSWKKARSIHIGGGVHADVAPRILSGLTENIRELYLDSIPAHIPSALPLGKLEKLSADTQQARQQHRGRGGDWTEAEFEALVRPGLESGTLRELDFRPLPARALLEGGGDGGARAALAWFRGASVTHLSLTGFARNGCHAAPRFDDAVLALLDRFPAARHLDFGDEPVSDSLVARLIARRAVASVHYRCRPLKADLAAWARRAHGAAVVDARSAPRYHPRAFPQLPL